MCEDRVGDAPPFEDVEVVVESDVVSRSPTENEVDTSIFRIVEDVEVVDFDVVPRSGETVGAEFDDDVSLFDDVEDEVAVDVDVPPTYFETVEDLDGDEPVLEDVRDVADLEADPVT